MSIPQIVEVVIGLIFVYYVLGSIVSLITQWINESLETRGKAVEKYLKKIVGDAKVGDLVSLPQLQALRPIRYKNFLSVLTSATEPKMVEKIPVATLVDAYFDLVGFTANAELNPQQITELINKLPDSEGKRAFIKWVEQGVTNIEDLRRRTFAYFTGLMEQASATFRSNARSFVITLSLVLTLLLGVDSIELVKALWTNAEFRAVAVAKAQMAVVTQEEGAAVTIEQLLNELSDLTLRVGWWRMTLPESSDPAVWIQFALLKILGLSLTVAAVSQGSSFWYDLFKRLTSPVKGFGGGDGSNPPEEKG